MTTSRALLLGLVAASINATVWQSWQTVAVAALFACGFIMTSEQEAAAGRDVMLQAALESRLSALEAKPDSSAQLEALSQKIHDPTSGLVEQIRQLRNLAAFKR